MAQSSGGRTLEVHEAGDVGHALHVALSGGVRQEQLAFSGGLEDGQGSMRAPSLVTDALASPRNLCVSRSLS